MSRVRVLSDGVVNQIAAGEVVERPASVVKELVENALDAEATRIEVLLKAGGRDRVRITDDGFGMDREDAMMCLERHATSKIRATEDLVDVASLGFRGEAIPSIASVSKLTIHTCTAEAEAGVRVEVDGGVLKSARAAGCAVGTVMDVQELFFNLPARRKFLRTASTELAHCQEAVVRQALGRPDVAFRLQHDGRVVFHSEAGDAATRMRDVLGSDADSLLEVGFDTPQVQGTGHISALSVQRPAGRALYAYVNGRFVQDGVVRRAIADAYRDRVPRGRHPLVVLYLHLPSGEVDVNVHPAKTEVRFQDPRGVQLAITEGLRQALANQGLRATPMTRSPRYLEEEAPALPLRPVRPPPAAHPDDDPSVELRARVLGVVELREPVIEPSPAVPEPSSVPADDPVEPAMVAFPASALLAAEDDLPRTSSVRALRAIGPYGRRWVLCEGEDELVVVDHVLADVLLSARRLERDGRAERLLAPRRERLSEREVELLIEAGPALAELGIELAKLSPTELAIRTVPAALPRLHLDGLLKKLAQDPSQARRILAEAQTMPEPPDAVALKSMLASLEEAGLDAVIGRVPTKELARRR